MTTPHETYTVPPGLRLVDAQGGQHDPLSGVQAASVLFTQTAGDGVYTGEIALPAGATLLDIQTGNLVPWDGTVTLNIGDADDPDGYVPSEDLTQAQDNARSLFNVDGYSNQGAYLSGDDQDLPRPDKWYSASARSIIGTITQTGGTNVGRTLLTVLYAVPPVADATKA